MESENKEDILEAASIIQKDEIEETSEKTVSEIEDIESSAQNSSSLNLAPCEEVSNPVESPDKTLSFGEGHQLSVSSEISAEVPEAVSPDLNDQSLDSTCSGDDEDTFDIEKDYYVPSEEDSSVCVSLSHPHTHTRNPSEISESEMLKFSGQPYAVIGGKIFPFDINDEDFFPEFELPHDNDPRTNDIINDVLQAIPDGTAEILGDIDEIDAEATPLPLRKLELTGEDDALDETPTDRSSHPDGQSFSERKSSPVNESFPDDDFVRQTSENSSQSEFSPDDSGEQTDSVTQDDPNAATEEELAEDGGERMDSVTNKDLTAATREDLEPSPDLLMKTNVSLKIYSEYQTDISPHSDSSPGEDGGREMEFADLDDLSPVPSEEIGHSKDLLCETTSSPQMSSDNRPGYSAQNPPV